MKTKADRLLPLAAISLLVLSTAPSAFASTLTVNLNPNTKVAEMNAVSVTKMVLTYPANSTMSHYMKNVSSSVVLSGAFDGSSIGVQEFQGDFHDEDSGILVRNMSVSIDYTANGNATTMVLHKQTNITAWVTGVFSVVNGTVQADMKWRSFVVLGALNLNLGDHQVDINQVGSTWDYSLASHTTALQLLTGSFGGDEVWSRPTLNYSALSAPLTTWTKNYDSATNTTTFSKVISGSYSFNSSADFNGKKYALSVSSDPAATISIEGYAVASGNSLTIQSAPSMFDSSLWVAAAIGVVIVGIGVAYLAARTRSRSKTASIASLR